MCSCHSDTALWLVDGAPEHAIDITNIDGRVLPRDHRHGGYAVAQRVERRAGVGPNFRAPAVRTAQD